MEIRATCSVTPRIPDCLVNAADLEIIRTFGLTWQQDDDGRYFFFSEDYNGIGCLEVDDPREFLHDFEQEYPEGGDQHAWTEALRRPLAVAAERNQSVGLELIDEGITLQQVFQGMLQRDAGNRLEAIYLNGAFTGQPISEITEGGFVSRITSTRIDHIDTLDPGRIFEIINA